MVDYPIRCTIIDVDGGALHGIRTLEKSKPHIGKRGFAELNERGGVRITLDDGTVLWGCECWWVPDESDGPCLESTPTPQSTS